MRFLAKLNKFLLAKKMVAGPTTPIQNMVNAVVPCGLMLLMFSSETLIAKMSMMRTQYMVTPLLIFNLYFSLIWAILSSSSIALAAPSSRFSSKLSSYATTVRNYIK